MKKLNTAYKSSYFIEKTFKLHNLKMFFKLYKLKIFIY